MFFPSIILEGESNKGKECNMGHTAGRLSLLIGLNDGSGAGSRLGTDWACSSSRINNTSDLIRHEHAS